MLQMTDMRRPRRCIEVTPIAQKHRPDQRQELEDLRYICRKQRAVIAIMTVIAYASFAGMLMMAWTR